jgi:hypothetical protein
MSARLPGSSQNGHVVTTDAQRATEQRRREWEQRRHDLAAAYSTLPWLLVDDFERMALRQEVPVRLGALELVALIRRRRLKAGQPPRPTAA